MNTPITVTRQAMAPHPVMDPDLMRTLVCIAQEGNFTRAAESMGLTQQSISGHVKKLERMMGRRLLDRTTHRVSLTKDGEALLLYAREMLNITEHVRQHFSDNGLEGSIRLGFIEGFASIGLPLALGQLRRLHPGLEVYTETGRTTQLVSRLEAGSLDLILAGQRVGQGQGEVLWKADLRWVGDTDGLHDPTSTIRLAMLPAPSVIRGIALEALAKAGRKWAIFFESDSTDSLRAAVLANLGVTVFCNRLSPELSQDPFPTPEHNLPDLGQIEFFLRTNPGNGALVEGFAQIIRAIVPDVIGSSLSEAL